MPSLPLVLAAETVTADPFRAARPPLAAADLLGGRGRGRIHRAQPDLLVRID